MSTTGLKWTNSSLTTLEDCGERYKRRYIEREYRPGSTRMLRGRVVHGSVATSMLRRLEGFELPSVEEVRDLAATAFTKEWQEGVALDAAEREQGAQAVRARVQTVALELAVLHREKVAPGINPVGVERRITVKPKDMDITIEGTLDLIDATPAGEVIRDPKTAEKSPSKDMAHKSQQLSMYGLLRLAEVGTMPVDYVLDYLVRTPGRGELKYVDLHTTRDTSDLIALVNRLNTAVDAVAKGVFVPASPSAWWCSAAWCEYHDDCPYVRRGESRPEE